MEWVEITGKTVEEATLLALEQLGVAEHEAEIEILESAKAGLFGRVRGESRIRARVRPLTPRAKSEERGRGRSRTAQPANGETLEGSTPSPDSRPPRRKPAPRTERTERTERSERTGRSEPADQSVIEAGTSFLEGLLVAFGVSATVTTGEQGPYTEFRVEGDPAGLGVLIGPKAQTLQAVQELLRTVIYHRVGESSVRVLLDVAGYRERRRVALEAFTRKVAAEVAELGERRVLEPMSAMDRKVVHDTAGTLPGIVSQSEGEDPYRRVVLAPA